MREIHQGLPRRDFSRPSNGIIEVTVCAKSGLLPIAACNEGGVTLPFLEGTQPAQYCEIHGNRSPFPNTNVPISTTTMGGFDAAGFLDSLPMPTLQLDLFPGLLDDNTSNRNQNQAQNQNTRTQSTPRPPAQAGRNNPNIRTPQTQRGTTTQPPSFNNPFLDDDEPASPQGSTQQHPPNNMPATVPRDSRSQIEEAAQDYADLEDDMDLPPLYDYDGLPSWNPLE
jgi:penicillin-binding protein 1A